MSKILFNKSNVNLDYPICRPSLDLDFTQEVLDERITFSRGSIGTRVNRFGLIETVSANQPRFDYDPVTGECKGLLIEESRRNLLTYSNDFDDASWTKFISTVSANTTTAPDNNLTADTLIPSGGATIGLVRQDISGLADNTTYTFSIFLKTAGLTNVNLQFYNKANTFHGSKTLNLSTGVLSGSDTIGTSLVVSYGNGWYRLILTNLGSGTGATTPNIRIVVTSMGNGTSGIYIWGAQLEASTFASSYIPTTVSTVTRSTDIASMTGTNFSNWYNQSEGTLYAAVRINALGTIRFPGVVYVDNGTNQSTIGIYIDDNSTDRIGTESYITNRRQYQIFSSSAITPNLLNKVITSYSFNNFRSAFSMDSSVTADINGLVPTVNRLLLGDLRGGLGTNVLNGVLARFTYYPRRLKDNQLLLLTQ